MLHLLLLFFSQAQTEIQSEKSSLALLFLAIPQYVGNIMENFCCEKPDEGDFFLQNYTTLGRDCELCSMHFTIPGRVGGQPLGQATDICIMVFQSPYLDKILEPPSCRALYPGRRGGGGGGGGHS